MMLNVGVWGWGPKKPADFLAANRALEDKVRDLGGMKWLYAHTYYPEDQFWAMHGGRSWYDDLRTRYRATALPTVWEKVHVDEKTVTRKGKTSWTERLKARWPFGGLWGLWISIKSRDYLIHRRSAWKWKGEKQ